MVGVGRQKSGLNCPPATLRRLPAAAASLQMGLQSCLVHNRPDAEGSLEKNHLDRERDMAHMRVPTPSARQPSRRRTAAAPKRSSCTCGQHHTFAPQLTPRHPADLLTTMSWTRHQGAASCVCTLHAIPTSCAPCQPMPEHAAGLIDLIFAGVSNGCTWHAAL